MGEKSEVIGPDSKFSWIMIIGCFIVNSVTYGMIRSQGVYYLSVISNYNVSRAEAAWPFSICFALTSLNGPIAGALCQKYGSRPTVLVGMLLATLGLSLGYFADSIPELIAFVGVIHGFGLGLAMTPIPITINQYFVKHRATAQGVAFSGSTLMSFALPAILNYCIGEYGLRGSFLLGGAIVLNGAIGGVILQTPPWLRKKIPPPDRTTTNIVAAAILASEKMSNVVGPSSPSSGKLSSKGSIAWESQRAGTEPKSMESDLVEQELAAEEQRFGAHYQSIECVDDVFEKDSSLQHQRRRKANPTVAIDSQSIRRVSSSSGPAMPITDTFRVEANQPNGLERKVKKVARAIAGVASSLGSIVKHPMFIIICLSWASFMFVFLTYILIITDFVVDQGIDPASSVILYTAFSGGDLFGRLGLGWVTDKGYVKRRTYVAVCLFVMGFLILCQPFIGNFFELYLATAALLGTIVGSILVLFFVLYATYLKPEQVPMAIGLNTAFNGAIMLARPVVLGFFRDSLGSYSFLFFTFGGILIAVSSLWLLEPLIMRRVAAKKPTVEIAVIS